MSSFAGVAFGAISVLTVVVTAIATFYVAKRRETKDYTTSLTDIVQAQEIDISRLKSDKAELAAANAQLMREKNLLLQQIFSAGGGDAIKHPEEP